MTKTDTLRGRLEAIAKKCGLRENGIPPDLWIDNRVLKAMTLAYKAAQLSEAEIEELARALECKAWAYGANGHDRLADEFAAVLRGKLGGTR